MELTPQQSQMLQYYMQKNRAIPQGQPAPVMQAMPTSPNEGVSGGLSNILRMIGSNFDTPTQGPIQPGATQLPQGESWLTQFANRIDPEAAQQRQLMMQQQNAPKIDMQQVMAALAKAGIR